MKDKILIDEPVREERIGESRDQNRIDSYKKQKTENFFRSENSKFPTCDLPSPSTFNLQQNPHVKFKIFRPTDPRVPLVCFLVSLFFRYFFSFFSFFCVGNIILL